MIYATVFLAGAVNMAIEMLASRLLAPYFGSSLFIWASLIGVIMLGLSIGYFLGGTMADRWPFRSSMAWLLVPAGLFILMLAGLVPPVVEWVTTWFPGPRWGSFGAALLLFGLPSVLLGGISPYAIRLKTQSVENVGNTSGALYAVSTVGSIVGTLLTAFYLIPAYPLPAVLTGLGWLVLILSILLLGRNRWQLSGAALAAGVAVVLLSGAPGQSSPMQSPDAEIVFEQNTLYHHLRVIDSGASRYLKFGDSFQSGMYRDEPYRARFEYTAYMDLGFLFNPDAKRLGLIGLGGGSIPRRYLHDYPQVTLDAAEIDPAVVRVAREYFQLPSDPKLNLHVQDGRRYLLGVTQPFDMILLDAYYSDSIPFHLVTREFIQLSRERLSEKGVLVANFIGALEGPESDGLRRFVKTVSSVFPAVYLFPVGERAPSASQNVIVVATVSSGNHSARELQTQAQEWLRTHGGPEQLPQYAADLYRGRMPLEDVDVFTDDHAPVNSLLEF